MIKHGAYIRPVDPPIFGDTSNSFQTQTASTINCDVISSGITAEQRMEATESEVVEEKLTKDKNDMGLPLAVEVSSDNIPIYKIFLCIFVQER